MLRRYCLVRRWGWLLVTSFELDLEIYYPHISSLKKDGGGWIALALAPS